MFTHRNRIQIFNHVVESMIALSTCTSFSSTRTNVHGNNNKNFRADSILKNYFNMRSEMSNANMVELIDRLKNVKVSSGFFNDHRWVHLNVAIQKNLNNFTIQDQLKILQGLTKLNNFNDLFNIIVLNLSKNMQALNPNQKCVLMYFMAKNHKVKPQIIRNLSDSLIIQLNNKDLQLKYGKRPQPNIKNNYKKEKQQESQQNPHEQSLFQDDLDINSKSPISEPEVDCRNLILCLWSLQKMKIKDEILEQCLIRKFIRPNIPNMPANIFPLLLSTLWMKGMQNKRIFQEVVFELWERQSQLLLLDRDKLKMLICMLCKPLIHKSEQKPSKNISQNKNTDSQAHKGAQMTESSKKIDLEEKRNQLILWLMQTLSIKHQHNQEYIFATSAYQILSNVSEANIMDFELYNKYLQIICYVINEYTQDLSKIQTKQIIYLLSILQKMMKIFKQSMKQQRKSFSQNQFENQSGFYHNLDQHHNVLSENLQKNILKFFNKTEQDNLARVILRKMVISGFIVFPNHIKRNIIHEERLMRQKSATTTHQKQKNIDDQQNEREVNQRTTSSKSKHKNKKKSNQKQMKRFKKQKKQYGPKNEIENEYKNDRFQQKQ